jgi:prepilin-type N-terminal cleavage/methylation domain-containing protein
MRTRREKRGFSLLEMLIAMALGLIVLGSAVQLFKKSMDATRLVVQRAEMQQNMRAAIELISKDISLAGAGIPPGGIQLPTGGVRSKYGCDYQSGACHVLNNTYPNGNYMYGVVPGFASGVENGAGIPAAPAAVNDSITVVYTDNIFPLNEYNATFPAGPNPSGQSVNIAANPNFIPAPPLATAVGGLQVGDLIWLQNTAGNAVGEVTGFNNGSISFADNDVLLMNQSGAAANNIKALAPGGTMVANRIYVVTYYLTVPANGQLPRLMRQVNAQAPVPVADDIINLQFAYDIYNTNTNALDPNQANPLGAAGDDLNNLQKINLSVMGQSLLTYGRNAQSMALATSVSTQNMAFKNRYQ